MKYSSFYEYAQDIYFEKLFKVNGFYGSGRILKIDDGKLITYYGIAISGSLMTRFAAKREHKSWIIKLLRLEVEEAWCWEEDLQLSSKDQPVKWRFFMNPNSCLNYKVAMEWNGKQLPMTLGSRFNMGLSEEVIIDNIDLNLKTIVKGQVPDKIVREKLDCLEDYYMLANIGVRWIKPEEKCDSERVGFYTKSINRGYPKPGLFKHTWWDIPNNNQLVWKDLNNFVKSNSAVYLPFISTLTRLEIKMNVAMGFDYDDFLPNPKKTK